MKSGARDEAEGKWHKVKGKIKGVAATLSDNKDLEAEGKKESKTSEVQEKLGEIKKIIGKQKGWVMASNFKISFDKISDGFGLKLAGDFDATSAYELIYAIEKVPDDILIISIHTDGLKNISPFGLDVFHRNMSPLDNQSKKILYTGNKASHMSPGDSRLSF